MPHRCGYMRIVNPLLLLAARVFFLCKKRTRVFHFLCQRSDSALTRNRKGKRRQERYVMDPENSKVLLQAQVPNSNLDAEKGYSLAQVALAQVFGCHILLPGLRLAQVALAQVVLVHHFRLSWWVPLGRKPPQTPAQVVAGVAVVAVRLPLVEDGWVLAPCLGQQRCAR